MSPNTFKLCAWIIKPHPLAPSPSNGEGEYSYLDSLSEGLSDAVSGWNLTGGHVATCPYKNHHAGRGSPDPAPVAERWADTQVCPYDQSYVATCPFVKYLLHFAATCDIL